MKAYAGIGSRSTPQDILGVMRNIAHDLALKGWQLRSGAAEGADTAFENGAWDAKQLAAGWCAVPDPEEAAT